MIALNLLDFQNLAQLPAARLLNTSIAGIGIAMLAWVLLRVTGRQSSGTRFAVWFFALLAIAALPFIASSAPHPLAATVGTPFTISSSWAVYLLAGWAAISALCCLRLGIGLWQIRRLRGSCAEVDLRTLDPALRKVMEEFESVRPVKFCVSDRVKAPAAVGFFHPAIVVPAWGLTDLSVDELKVTLLHELAHLRRWDDWTNLVQKMVKAIFFFHPAVWWIDARLALEREMACDDQVLAQTENPKAYAASLISFAEKIQRGRELALVHAVVGRARQISRRVTRILDSPRPRATQAWKPALGLVAVISAAALVSAPYAPQLVAFQERSYSRDAANDKAPRVVAVPVAMKESFAKAAQPGSSTYPPVVPMPVAARLKLRSTTKPHLTLAKAIRPEMPLPETTFVMQSVRFDSQGSPVLTLCVWRVMEDSRGHKTVETTYFVRKI